MKILIAGASGFIGEALIERLLIHESIEIVALSRKVRESTHPRVKWMRCDLFSMKDIGEAMQGCDQAFYLVHSMLPSADLSQGSFYDFDLILADNFARCAKKAGLQHIIYLGGMIPDSEQLSWHLKSRLEVEDALRESSIPVTTLRAGLIIGKNGSSFEILRNLVRRLPLMVCPAWTLTESQPIALSEMMDVLESCAQEMPKEGRIYDVGGPEVLTYQNLILLTAKAMGLSRRIFSFNLVPIGLSRLWVSLITGSSKDLVYPLVLSLKHRMVSDSSRAWTRWKNPRIGMSAALRLAIEGASKRSLKGAKIRKSTSAQDLHDVRSIQRLYHPPGRTAEWVAGEYFRWLPSLFVFLIRVKTAGKRCTFSLLTDRFPLLILEKSEERSTPDRQLLYIKGGLLVSKRMGRGRLEFREALRGRVILAAIHEFVPALPWIVYRNTQAVLHVIVMRLFERHLREKFR
ncbi:MAG: NAD(P)H-binding protein [Bdellovibrionales bacterium]|nr:NAD(P)H-binding protein [Bdellovibrionales bacterium]